MLLFFLFILIKCLFIKYKYIYLYQQTKTKIMETVYIYDGVAYLSKDLAILNGADKLSLYELKLNETLTENIDIRVELKEVTFEDEYLNELSFETIGLEYMEIKEPLIGLSKETKDRIQSEMVIFVDNFDEEEYLNDY